MSTPNPTSPTLLSLPASGIPAVVVHAVERPANMIVVIHLRPNGDPAGDSRSTLYVTKDTTAAEIASWVTTEKRRVADEYLAAHNALSTLIAAIGT